MRKYLKGVAFRLQEIGFTFHNQYRRGELREEDTKSSMKLSCERFEKITPLLPRKWWPFRYLMHFQTWTGNDDKSGNALFSIFLTRNSPQEFSGRVELELDIVGGISPPPEMCHFSCNRIEDSLLSAVRQILRVRPATVTIMLPTRTESGEISGRNPDKKEVQRNWQPRVYSLPVSRLNGFA